jgi:hypothetical protein
VFLGREVGGVTGEMGINNSKLRSRAPGFERGMGILDDLDGRGWVIVILEERLTGLCQVYHWSQSGHTQDVTAYASCFPP